MHTRHIPCGSVCMDHAEYTHLWGERVGQCSCGSKEGAGTGAVTPTVTGWGGGVKHSRLSVPMVVHLGDGAKTSNNTLTWVNGGYVGPISIKRTHHHVI